MKEPFFVSAVPLHRCTVALTCLIFQRRLIRPCITQGAEGAEGAEGAGPTQKKLDVVVPFYEISLSWNYSHLPGWVMASHQIMPFLYSCDFPTVMILLLSVARNGLQRTDVVLGLQSPSSSLQIAPRIVLCVKFRCSNGWGRAWVEIQCVPQS